MTPQLSPELQARIVKLVRDMTMAPFQLVCEPSTHFIEARAIADLLPPEFDPDRVKAEELLDKFAKGTTSGWVIDAIYEAIQHGRAAGKGEG